MPEFAIADDELYTANYLAGKLQSILAQHGGLNVEESIFEQAMKWRGWTGHPDLVAQCMDGTVHLVDWKTGWGDVPDADTNLQIRVYVCMIAGEYKEKDEFYAHIVSRAETTSTLYTKNDIVAASAESQQIYANICAAEKAKANPGAAQCQYCRACGLPDRCPESCATAGAIVEATSRAVISPQQLATILDLAKVAEAAIKKARDLAREQIINGVEIPGWHLAPGNTRKEITDAAEAYVRTAGLICEKAAFECCKMSRCDLIQARADRLLSDTDAVKNKLSKKDALATATAEIDAALAELVVEKQNQPTLEKANQ
jgi:hypothetical protein